MTARGFGRLLIVVLILCLVMLAYNMHHEMALYAR